MNNDSVILLKEEKEWLSALLNSVHDGIIATDTSGKILFLNQIAERLTGGMLNNVKGWHFDIVFNIADKGICGLSDFTKGVDCIVKPELCKINQSELISKSGARYKIECTCMPILNKEKTNLGHIIAFRDVTEKMKAYEALIESETRYRDIITNTGDWIWEVDIDGRFTFSDDHCEKILGYKPQEIIKKHFYEFYDTQDKEKLFISGRNFPAYKKPLKNALIRTIQKNGNRVYLELNVVEIIKHNKVVGFRGTGSDVTQKILLNEKLKLFAKVFENTIEGIIITNIEGNILSVNPAFTQITGYKETEVINQNPRILKSDRHEKEFYKDLWDSILKTGLWEGEIWNRRKNGEAFPEWLTISAIRNDNGKIINFVGIFNDITELKLYEERIKYQAYHDPLTGLPNRKLFLDRLEKAVAHTKLHDLMLAVLFIDLDGFKNVNDTYGHYTGDRLLQIAARRFKKLLSAENTVARMGGDEFTIIYYDLHNIEDLVKLAHSILIELHQPLIIDGKTISITPSIGITVQPADGDDAKTLLKNADMAMYRAKEHGKNTYEFYTAELKKKINVKLELEKELHNSFNNDEFQLFYQPMIDLSTKNIFGVEALIRWNHPDRGLILPDDFILIMEESNLIIPVGEWIIRKSLLDVQKWNKSGFNNVIVSINISGNQFHDKNFLNMLSVILADINVNTKNIFLELSQDYISDDISNSIKKIIKIKEPGFGIILDNFGAEKLSITDLLYLPVDILKMDKSFVKNITSGEKHAALASALINLGHSVNMKVAAKFVETKEQILFLQQNKCDIFQGFLFSPPIEEEQIPALLKESKLFI